MIHDTEDDCLGKNRTDNTPSMGPTSAVSCTPTVSPSRANLYAQALNNSAALCIEVGLHERAIVSLKRALNLYKKFQQNINDVPVCNSYDYSLEGCICSTKEEGKRSSVCNKPTSPSVSFISKQPIKVPARGQTMGPALKIIIAHNLGIAYHQVALHSCESSERQKSIILSAMATYNLAYETQNNLIDQCHVHNNEAVTASIRSNQFKMIIVNNMSQLHKLNTDDTKHDRCLRTLLPLIMLVVDQQGRASSAMEKPPSRIELDGFLQNTVPMILTAKYTADAA